MWYRCDKHTWAGPTAARVRPVPSLGTYAVGAAAASPSHVLIYLMVVRWMLLLLPHFTNEQTSKQNTLQKPEVSDAPKVTQLVTAPVAWPWPAWKYAGLGGVAVEDPGSLLLSVNSCNSREHDLAELEFVHLF